MASFFFPDGADPHTQDASAKRLRAVSGGQAQAESPWRQSDLAHRRPEASPPDLFAQPPATLGNWLKQAWAWLWDMDESPRRPAPATGLPLARNEFHSAIWDLQSLRANHLREQIAHARSLRELWHLRADVFKLISVHRGQAEAQERLDRLDAHFPVRASHRGANPARAKHTVW